MQMSRRQSGFTRASSLGPIADVVGRQGGSILRVLRDVDLPVALLESPEMLVPLREQFRLLERSARATGDPEFGARLGRDVRIRNLSAFGKWVSEADSLAGAIDRSRLGLNRMLQSSTELMLTVHGETAHWSIEFLEPECEGRYHNELLGLGYMIDAVRCYAGPGWSPELVLVSSAKGTAKGRLEQILDAEVSTGHAVPAIRFHAPLLSNSAANPAPAPEASSPGGEPPVPGNEDDLASIEAVAALALSEAYPRIDWVAAKLGLTRRTLQRRLAERGTTFATLVESLLRKNAEALLARTAEPVTDIALRLGYAEMAHFTRAFKRWTGMAPSAYRRANNP
jgi:AraC-like DNA-binding protein